jgi:hypothetical protein
MASFPYEFRHDLIVAEYDAFSSSDRGGVGKTVRLP